MVGWTGCTATDCAGRTVADWDLGGSLDRSSIHLPGYSWAAAEGTAVADRTQHRIAAGFGMAAVVADVAVGSCLLAAHTGFRHTAGMGGRGDTAGTAGRWTHDMTARARRCTAAVGSLAVAIDHIPGDREFHSLHTVEAARRTRAAVVVVAVGSNPGSSRSWGDVGSWLRPADFTCLLLG